MSRLHPIQNELFREVLRLRELGFSLSEMEARLPANRQWVGTVYASICEYSMPIPVRHWSFAKLRTVIGSEEFSELLARSIPDFDETESKVSEFIIAWMTTSQFKTDFESTNDIVAWVANHRSVGNGSVS